MVYSLEILVLVDNNTIIDKYYYGEPGLSFLIKQDNLKILFDTGYSDIFLKNADIAGENIFDSDIIVISHGHNDHTGGLNHLCRKMVKNTRLVAHRNAFTKKIFDNSDSIGSDLSEEMLNKYFQVELSKEPKWLSKNIVFLGEIPRIVDFEDNHPVGYLSDTAEMDYLLDDSALAIRTKHGIVIITGCSHSGIANICEYTKEIFINNKIISIVGGMHLLDADQIRIDNTIKYFKTLNLESLYACHCTGFNAMCQLSKEFNFFEVGSGLKMFF